MQNLRQTKAFLLLILGLGLMIALWQASERGKLTIYCAHDAVFAEEILRDFSRKTGIPIAIKYDTEATKSLGLAEQIIRESKNPRADVFWNNELLGTLDLAERGLLEPHQGEGWKRIPAGFRDPEGRWAGFAARLRVVIRNPKKETGPLAWIPEGNDLSHFAVAKPLYGTTLTHYSVLWAHWGPENLKAWHAATRAAGIREVNGNGPVKDVVVEGACAAGWTDTDDYFAARDAGSDVTAEPVALKDGGTICIPNTVAIIRNSQRQDQARKLVDFLLSERAEVALARSKSRQIPLGPLAPSSDAQIPAEVRALMPAAARGVPLNGLLPARNACLEWLKLEYTR